MFLSELILEPYLENESYNRETIQHIYDEFISIFENKIKLKEEYLRPIESNDLQEICFEFIDIIKDFEEKYLYFTRESTINSYIQQHTLTAEQDKKYQTKIFPYLQIKESYIEIEPNNYQEIINFFNIENSSGTYSFLYKNPRSFALQKNEYDVKKPLYLIKYAKSETFDLGIKTPNFNKRFYVLGDEKFCFYSLHDINSFQQLLANILTTILILKCENNAQAFTLFFLLKTYSMPVSTLYLTFLKNSQLEHLEGSISNVNVIKDESFITEIYDKLSIINKTSSLLQIIDNNLRKSLFDYMKDELLNKLIGLSINTEENAFEFCQRYIFYPIQEARQFILQNDLPSLYYHNTQKEIQNYTLSSYETIIHNQKIRCNGSPMITRINSSEQVTLGDEFLRNSIMQYVTQKVKVFNGRPIKIYVNANQDSITYDTDFAGNNTFEELLFISIPVASWSDACNYCLGLQRLNSVKLKQTTAKCSYRRQVNVVDAIDKLIRNTDEFNGNFNLINKTFDISFQYMTTGN